MGVDCFRTGLNHAEQNFYKRDGLVYRKLVDILHAVGADGSAGIVACSVYMKVYGTDIRIGRGCARKHVVHP